MGLLRQPRPATRFCPARDMFLNYNGNRPAAWHRVDHPYTMYQALVVYHFIDKRRSSYTTLIFYGFDIADNALERTMDCGYGLAIFSVSARRHTHVHFLSDHIRYADLASLPESPEMARDLQVSRNCKENSRN